MRTGKLARFLLMAMPLMAGCGNFWQAPTGGTGSSGCTTNCTTASSGNFYILDAGSNPGIVGASIQTGTLTSITGSPWLLSQEGTPYSMAIAPNGDFLAVSTITGVWAFPITNGALGTAVQVTDDATAEAIQIDTTGSWLIEALPQTNGQSVDGITFAATPINIATGAPAGAEQTASFTATNASLSLNQMAISGDNLHIFVPLGAAGTIVVSFNSGVGSGSNPFGTNATTIPVVTAGGTALSVAVDPGITPRLFYIGETLANSAANSGGLRAFNYSSLGGTLAQAAGSPIASGGLSPSFILPLNAGTNSGQYVYVANGTGAGNAGNISGFTITASSAATPVYTIATDTTATAGSQPLGMAEDSTGTFVFEVGEAGSPYFDSYTFDTTVLGQLDSQLTATTPASSIAIVAAP
jgi:hypothetical protein